MPVVLTDSTNKVWAVEQPNDGLIHVGYTGSPGPSLIDVLDFVKARQKQFAKFEAKRKATKEERWEIGESIGDVQKIDGRTRVSTRRRNSGTSEK